MSKSIYRAGRTIIADEFIELGGNSSTTSIMQSVNLAVNQKKINELKSEIEKINSDGIITPPEKQSLKREWGNLESSYNKTYSQFENDDNLKNNPAWINLQQDFAELDSIMSKVLSNMNISYSESDTERIDDLFYSCWTLINECSGIYENALDFHNRYELRILGQKEFNDSTELSAATYSKTLNQFTNMPDSEFSWYRTADGRLIKSSSKTCSFVISDLDGEKECEFYCLWTHSLGDNDNSVVKIVVFFTLSIKKITEYQWNNIESESDLNKQDIYWSLEKTNQPNDMKYLWIRESDDNRETWVYSRWSGLQGPEGPQGWSQATIQLYKRSSIIPESYDGEAVIYTFATGSIEGNTGTWNKEIPTGSELLYTIFASCLSKQQTDIIQPNEWTEPQQISTEGTKGENGISVATVFIYQRSQSSPSLPTQTASYNFLNGQLYVQAPWSNTIPSGADPCWVSTATASSRTSSANIDISKWSIPVILVQNGQDGQDGQDGNDGIGISSLIEEYGISNSINLIPTQWYTTRPTRNEGEILWYRVKIIYTDGSVIYTDAIPSTGDKGDKGDKGESGENAPTPIYQYAWGGSQTVPPSPNIWVWRGKFFIWKHKFVGKDVNSLWGEYKNKPENKKVFLWTRISNDNGKTWSKPICISGNDGDDAVVFDINIIPSSYKMTTRKYVKEDQVIQLLCEKSESYKGKEVAVWEIVSTTYLKFCDITGEIIYEGNSMTGDSVYVLVKTGMEETTFKVVCTVSDVGTKETYVSGDYSEFVPEYIGKVDSTLGQKWPTMTENGPVKKGDLIVYIKSDESGNKTSEYYICVDEAKAGTADGWSVNIVDSHNNSSNMIKGIYDAILSGSTNADLLRLIDTLVARYIAAQLIRVTGAIFGGDYKIDESSGQVVHIDDPDEQENGGQGFAIDKNGLLRAVKALLNDVTISSYDQSYLLLNTVKSVKGAKLDTTVNNSFWSVSDMYNALSDNGVVNYDGKDFNYQKNATYTWNGAISASASSSYMHDSDSAQYAYPVYEDGYIEIELDISGSGSGPGIGGYRYSGTISVITNTDEITLNGSGYKTATIQVNKGDVIRVSCDISAQVNSPDFSCNASANFYVKYFSTKDYIIMESSNGKYVVLSKDDNVVRNNKVKSSIWNSDDNLNYAEYSSLKGFLDNMPINTILNVNQDSDYIEVLKNGIWIRYAIANFYYTDSEIVFYTADNETIKLPLNTYANANILTLNDVGPSVKISITVNEIKGALEFGPMVPYAEYSAIGSETKKVPIIYSKKIIGEQITADSVYGAVFN